MNHAQAAERALEDPTPHDGSPSERVAQVRVQNHLRQADQWMTRPLPSPSTRESVWHSPVCGAVPLVKTFSLPLAGTHSASTLVIHSHREESILTYQVPATHYSVDCHVVSTPFPIKLFPVKKSCRGLLRCVRIWQFPPATASASSGLFVYVLPSLKSQGNLPASSLLPFCQPNAPLTFLRTIFFPLNTYLVLCIAISRPVQNLAPSPTLLGRTFHAL